MQRKSARTLNFTKLAVEALKPPQAGRDYHYDEKLRGLALCVTAAGTKTFYVARRIGLKFERVRIGGWPELSVEQARNLAAQVNGSVAKGINPNESRRADRRVQTLGDAFSDFLALPTRTKAKRPRSAKTLHDYRQQFSAYLEPWRDRRLVQISRADVEGLHNDLGAKSGFVTANRVLALLRALYNAAIEAGYSGPNPTTGVRKFEERSRERFLQRDELPKFFAALESEPSEKIRDFVLLALFVGQRRSNTLAMRWQDVNLERAVWSIATTKSGRPHDVPLSQPALEVLRRRQQARGASEYVFPGLHDHGHLKDPMRQWRGILERAGIDDLTIHDLRRSLGSWQTSTGTNAQIIGRTLGHSDPAATQIYARVDLTAVRQSMETAGAAILAAAKPAKAKRKAGNKNAT
jgi:integrase